MTNETLAPQNQNEVPPLSAYFVGREIVNSRVKRYMNGKHKKLTSDIKAKEIDGEESKFVWYPKNYIENIVCEMDRYGANGLRVYFGEYGIDTDESAPGQLGLLLVLTKLVEDKICDLMFEKQADFEERMQKSKEMGMNFTKIYSDGKPREFNAMIPCPPVCLNHEPGFPEEEVS